MVASVYSMIGKRVFVAGHRGMVGSAILRALAEKDCEILTASRADLDLGDPAAVRSWMTAKRPHAVFVAAAKVGGILANSRFPADFLHENLRIATAVIGASHDCGVEKLLYLGSSCIYPRMAEQPIREEALLTGPLEPTNEWYAIAKIAGIKLCQAYRRQHGSDFISAMPTNLYGPGDNFDPLTSHVLPALMRKAHDAKQSGRSDITVWGTGKPRREFLHVDDCARALVLLMEQHSGFEQVNVGSGTDLTIAGLARIVCQAVGFEGAISFDASKPDGTPRKLMDGSRIAALGWKPKIELQEGIRSTYAWFLDRRRR